MRQTLTALFMCVAIAAGAQGYTRMGDVFSYRDAPVVAELPKGPESIVTRFKWRDAEGRFFHIYIDRMGWCYILRQQKDGSNKRDYLPEKLSREVCKEENIKFRRYRGIK